MRIKLINNYLIDHDFSEKYQKTGTSTCRLLTFGIQAQVTIQLTSYAENMNLIKNYSNVQYLTLNLLLIDL